MDYLTDEQLELLRNKLLEQKRQILEAEEEAKKAKENELFEATTGDEADITTQQLLRLSEERRRSRDRKLLRKIEKALQRMEDGTYGYCDECGDEIGFRRLKARPVAELCIDCKQEQERREKQEYEPEENDTYLLNDK